MSFPRAHLAPTVPPGASHRPSTAARESRPSLHDLLALPREADPRRVREVYGREVVQAMHAGNPRRAVALSAAFDALPLAERQRIRSAGAPARIRAPRVPRTFSLPGTLDASLPGVIDPASMLGARRIGSATAAVLSRLLLTAIGILAVMLVSHTVGSTVSGTFTSFAHVVSSWQQHAPILPAR